VRALAILEGKAAEKAEKDRQADAAGAQRFVLQVAAMSSQEKAAEVQARLRGAGINSYTQKTGELIKVKIGPLNKEDAEKMRAKLSHIGLSGFMTPA
jgi:DedD protein